MGNMPGEAPMWRVRLFEGPVLEDADGRETLRFRSEKVQGLLGFLALRLGRRCPREALADALWPDERDAAVTANRLRVTLASLRRQIEPPGTPFGSVLDASVPGSIKLREAAVWCDVAAFERAYAAGRLDEAAELLRGPLLPGLYDEWVNDEQIRYETLRQELAGCARSATTRERPAPLAAPAHRLPLYLTRFLGREAEQALLRDRLDESRLVTLTGPGGIGKTRIAVETAGGGETRAVFVSLANAVGQDGVAEAVLQALGIVSRAAGEPVAQLMDAVRARPPTLLLLDSAESAVEAIADLMLVLLADAPDLRVLVTSRQRLEVPGEAVILLPPLGVPSEATTLEELLAFPSAVLFLDRARGAVPDFALRERHVEAVVAICNRLEGMPLALELAGARVAMQSPARIAETLQENAMGLRSRQRGLSERHRSLRAAIQGSIEILSSDLQRFFAELSAFRSGWTAEAAAVVCEEPRAEEFLEELTMRSLVRVGEDAEGETRYAFLEPIRAYAATMPTGDARLRHCAYFVGLAAAATEDDVRTLSPLDAEEENLRLALEQGRTDPRYAVGVAGGLIHAFVRGRHRQALRWIEASADAVATSDDPAARFAWRYAAAQILPDVGRLDETDALARAMRADADEAGDARRAVYAMVILAYVVEQRGGIEASLALSAEALVRAREIGDRHLLETSLSHRSGTLHVYGSMVGPRSDAGRSALTEAEALAREMRGLLPPFSRRLALGPLLVAEALWQQGRLEEAVDFLKDAQTTAVRLGTTTELMYAFVGEAAIAAGWGHAEHAVELYGAFGALQERMGYSLHRAQSSRPHWIERLAVDLRARLGDETFDRLATVGRETAPATLAARRVSPR